MNKLGLCLESEVWYYMGRRSLKNQLQHSVCASMRLGNSKKEERERGERTELFLYSRNSVKKMFAFTNNFADWMRDNHPEVKWAKDITPQHLEEYGQDKRPEWTDKTCKENSHRAHKMGDMISNVFGVSVDLSSVYYASGGKESPENRAMTREDCDLLRECLLSKNTGARFLVDICSRTGARSEEARSVKAENIRMDRGMLELRNCKNGRDRDVPIRDKDIAFFAALKEYMIEHDWKNACNGITENACNRAIRSAMKEVGISDKYDQSLHACRKLYARERMDEEQNKGFSWVESWSHVQQELGHGDKYRYELAHAYLGI